MSISYIVWITAILFWKCGFPSAGRHQVRRSRVWWLVGEWLAGARSQKCQHLQWRSKWVQRQSNAFASFCIRVPRKNIELNNFSIQLCQLLDIHFPSATFGSEPWSRLNVRTLPRNRCDHWSAPSTACFIHCWPWRKKPRCCDELAPLISLSFLYMDHYRSSWSGEDLIQLYTYCLIFFLVIGQWVTSKYGSQESAGVLPLTGRLMKLQVGSAIHRRQTLLVSVCCYVFVIIMYN